MSEFVFKKKFGQNFISDTNLLNAIVKDAGIDKTDEVLEIGAGAGSLTKAISQNCKKLVSFEIDRDLQEGLLALGLENVEFCFADFMKQTMQEIEAKFKGKFKVVANLPYYITTPIIFRLLEETKKVESLTIMVQKEVAERVCAPVGGKDYGILAVMTNFYGRPKISRIVGRKMFFPEPNVDSAILHIDIARKFEDVESDKFSKFVKACFSMRRKTLLNNLSTIYSKEKLRTIFAEDVLRKRAEQFSLEELVELFKSCKNI